MRDELPHDPARSSLHRSVMRPGESVACASSLESGAKQARSMFNALSASSVGLELGISVMLGLIGGYYLDQYLGSTPWMMLLFLVFGLIAGFRGVLRAVSRAEKAADAEAARG